MPQFTTTDSLKFRSYLVAHGVDASTAEKVAAKVQRKTQRNAPFTDEERTLVDGYLTKTASQTSATNQLTNAGADRGHKIKIPGRLKWGDITLKKGRPFDVWTWRKMVEYSVYSPGTVRQLAYQVASS